MMRDATECNRLQVLQCFYNVDTRCDSFVKFIGWKSLSGWTIFSHWQVLVYISVLEKKFCDLDGNFVGEMENVK